MKKFALLLIVLLLLSVGVLAQDSTPTIEAPIEVVVSPETGAISDDIMLLILAGVSILAVMVMSVFSVVTSGGTANEAIKAGIESGTRKLISDEKLTSTVESRLNAIPPQYRNFLMELVNLASPITETSDISSGAAQWIKNVLDGNEKTGAVPFTASSVSESVNIETPYKNDDNQERG